MDYCGLTTNKTLSHSFASTEQITSLVPAAKSTLYGDHTLLGLSNVPADSVTTCLLDIAKLQGSQREM